MVRLCVSPYQKGENDGRDHVDGFGFAHSGDAYVHL